MGAGVATLLRRSPGPVVGLAWLSLQGQGFGERGGGLPAEPQPRASGIWRGGEHAHQLPADVRARRAPPGHQPTRSVVRPRGRLTEGYVIAG